MAKAPLGFSGMNQEAVELGRRLREAREYVRVTQEEASMALEVRRSAISEMEAGKRNVSALEMKRLAELYQRPSSWFTDEKPLQEDESIEFLARTVDGLSINDRSELANFAEFLKAKAKDVKGG